MKGCKFSLLAICLILALSTVGPLFGIRYAVSPSLPYKLFISRPIKQLDKNQYVSFEYPQSNILLAKQIIGVAGDYISIHRDSLFINEQEYGRVLEMSKSGTFYHPISEGRIPEGYVFAYAPNEESFDSRYQEFGLVKVEQIREILWPLF